MGTTRTTSFAVAVSCALAFASSGATAATLVDDFENGVNLGGWSFNVSVPDTIPGMGGNPGAWLLNNGIFSFAPILTTNGDSGFTGDFRAMGVTSISLDARTLSVDFGPPVGFEMSLLLRDTKDTPGVDDDDYAYFVGLNVPLPGQGWVHYLFDIPSQSDEAVPEGWFGGWVGDLDDFRPGVEWSDVITSVDQVEFWWINPQNFAIIQGWSAGADNLTLQTIPLPGALALMLTGLLGLAAARRR